eukprot:TRINITY_DN8043_c0_g2_i1.p1 TRINITY_DN8043_c0_g2~~TRINITY_DN8043_c0_g2_i1.p1  ORF type:complete len:576 (-),score=134.25 TRINITY_DN8043_c0_g2_i1:3-1691(-)
MAAAAVPSAAGVGGAARPLLEAESMEMEDVEEVVAFMSQADAFRAFPRSELPELARCFSVRVVSAGDVIVRQGEPGHELFFIHSGSVAVRAVPADSNAPVDVQVHPASGANGECDAGAAALIQHVASDSFSAEVEVATLGPGEYFGEAALMTDAPRNASCYASGGDVTLYVLSRERFEAMDLGRKLQLEIKYAELSNGLAAVFWSMLSFRSIVKPLCALAVYVLFCCIAFAFLEGWSWTDSFYFALITLTTVGYGDVAPQHPVSKVIVMVVVLLGLFVVAAAIGDFLEQLVTAEISNEKARKALRLQQPRAVGIFDEIGQRYRWRRRLCASVLALGVLLFITALLARAFLLDTSSWLDAIYFAVITLTTIGYGDEIPHRGGSKAMVGVVCVVGVPVFGMLLGRIVEIAYGKARQDQIRCIVGGLTSAKFSALLAFCDELESAGSAASGARRSSVASISTSSGVSPTNSNGTAALSGRQSVTELEFLSFILVKNDIATMDEIRAIRENFAELDVDKNGVLEHADLQEWQRKASREAPDNDPTYRGVTAVAPAATAAGDAGAHR